MVHWSSQLCHLILRSPTVSFGLHLRNLNCSSCKILNIYIVIPPFSIILALLFLYSPYICSSVFLIFSSSWFFFLSFLKTVQTSYCYLIYNSLWQLSCFLVFLLHLSGKILFINQTTWLLLLFSYPVSRELLEKSTFQWEFVSLQFPTWLWWTASAMCHLIVCTFNTFLEFPTYHLSRSF